MVKKNYKKHFLFLISHLIRLHFFAVVVIHKLQIVIANYNRKRIMLEVESIPGPSKCNEDSTFLEEVALNVML